MTEFSESLTDPFGPAAEAWMTGRTALVTGGGQQSDNEAGVGYAICRVLAAHGARIAVLDRDPAAAQRRDEALHDQQAEAGEREEPGGPELQVPSEVGGERAHAEREGDQGEDQR